jgi:hypothetical protein
MSEFDVKLPGWNVAMTVERALAVQSEQLDWYCRNLSPEKAAALREQAALRTCVRDLVPGQEYPVTFINRFVPRGGSIESLLGIDGGGP